MNPSNLSQDFKLLAISKMIRDNLRIEGEYLPNTDILRYNLKAIILGDYLL